MKQKVKPASPKKLTAKLSENKTLVSKETKGKNTERTNGLVINGKMKFPVFLKAFQNRYPYLGVEVMYSRTGHFINDTSDPISENNNSVEVVIQDKYTIEEFFEQLAKNYGASGSVYCQNSKGNTHFYGNFRKRIPLIELNDLCKELGCKNKPK